MPITCRRAPQLAVLAWPASWASTGAEASTAQLLRPVPAALASDTPHRATGPRQVRSGDVEQRKCHQRADGP
jgi:hypothetical protein